MRPIHLVQLDKARPAVILTRSIVLESRAQWTVVPITSRVRGLAVEVAVDQRNGIDRPSVANVDLITTIPVSYIGRVLGVLLPDQEEQLTQALCYAFNLDC